MTNYIILQVILHAISDHVNLLIIIMQFISTCTCKKASVLESGYYTVLTIFVIQLAIQSISVCVYSSVKNKDSNLISVGLKLAK